MSQISPVLISDLMIDVNNPRLPTPALGQREALRELAKHQGRKLVALAEDIAANGLNPADLLIVMPFPNSNSRYVVFEGNRRFVTLKCLEAPDTLNDNGMDAKILTEIRRLSKLYQESPIDYVQCCVCDSRDEAKHWIELRHTGEMDGAGIVPWGSHEKSRFMTRSGARDLAVQALDFLEQREHLSPETRRTVPLTTLQRMLTSAAIRTKCGVEVKNGILRLLASEDSVAKALMYIVNDLISGNANVNAVKSKEDRTAYAENMPAPVVAELTGKIGEGVPIEVVAPKAKSKSREKSQPPLPKVRTVLIPADCALSIGDVRIRQIEHELRRLNLDQFTNAVSVMFRVFIELSTDAYIESRELTITTRDDRLSAKLNMVVADLQDRKKLSREQAAPIRKFTQTDSFLVPSLLNRR